MINKQQHTACKTCFKNDDCPYQNNFVVTECDIVGCYKRRWHIFRIEGVEITGNHVDYIDTGHWFFDKEDAIAHANTLWENTTTEEQRKDTWYPIRYRAILGGNTWIWSR